LRDRRADAPATPAVDLSRAYSTRDQRLVPPGDEDVRAILARMGKTRPEDELDCGACGYATCREHAVAISEGLAESEMCLPYMIEQLSEKCDELTRTNERLESTRQALSHAEKLASMGQLAAGIAHEVNNPLSTVLALSQLLAEEAPADTPAGEDLRLIASEAGRCKGIVSGLLQFARRNRVEASRVDLADLVRGVERSLEREAGLLVRVERRTPDTTAELDRDQMMQVLTNLVQNARDAMPAGGELGFVLDGDAESVRLSVRDTGCGITPEVRPRIFDPFFTTKPAGKGTGLGLAVTYGIVKMHNGRIEVESNADPATGPTGTAFTVELPRRRPETAQEINGAQA
jgi:signal transduction histidine kinase